MLDIVIEGCLQAVVQDIHTVFGIANKYGLSLPELMEANPEMKQEGYVLQKGATLVGAGIAAVLLNLALGGLGSSPFARHYLGNHCLFSLPTGTKMFQFPAFAHHIRGVTVLQTARLSHSEIHESKVICTSS